MGVISFSMIINHKQTCIINFVDCRKTLHSYFTHHTRKYFGCERRRGLRGGRHVVARVDVLKTTCAAGGPLGLASGKLPSAHIASYEKGRCCQAPPCGETGLRLANSIILFSVYSRKRVGFLDKTIVLMWNIVTILTEQLGAYNCVGQLY